MTEQQLRDAIYATARKLARLVAEAERQGITLRSDELASLHVVEARIRGIVP